jgi:hypothetical protein
LYFKIKNSSSSMALPIEEMVRLFIRINSIII